MSWLTETLNKIAKSYKGLNTSAMQGAGSMGLQNIERAAEKMNPEEAKEFKQKAKANLVTGTMLAPAVPFLVNGLVTAPVTTALELAGGTAAGIGATLATDKAIEAGSNGKYTGFTDYVTKKFPDSNPYIVEQFHPAAWIGSLLGGWGTRNVFIRTPRGRVELVNSELAKNISNTKLNNSEFDKAVLSGKVGWGPNQIIHYRHGSYNPNLSKFEVHNTWDVTNRNASPFKWFGTEVSSPKNMMDDRPYQYIGLTEIKKPMTQLGEYNIKGKNDTRNYLVAESRQRGADAYYLQGIADNKAKDQNVLIKFLDHNGEPGGFGIKPSKLTEAEKLGIPKGERNSYLIGSNADPSYYSALGLNNNKYIQSLRDFHFKQTVPDNVFNDQTFVHSTNTNFNVFDKKFFGSTDDGYHGKGFYFSTVRPASKLAKQSGVILGPHGEMPIMNYGKNKMYVYLKGVPSEAKTSTYNYFDQPDELGVALTKGTISKPIVAEIITGNPSNIKSANAITYDDFGNIIPLSKRDNFNIFDIRYKQGGSIHIKEKNKGKFTESAKRAGKSVQEHAKDVVNNPKATKLQKKRAQFALNSKKFKH